MSAYNAAAALGLASAYVNGACSIVLALSCLAAGTTALRGGSEAESSTTASAVVTKVDLPVVTVTFTYNGKEYTVNALTTRTLLLNDTVEVSIPNDNPNLAQLNPPEVSRSTLGWGMLGCGVLLIAAAVFFIRYATDSRNFAAAAGALTFFRAVFGLL